MPDENTIALELEQTRPYLMRFALLQLRNETAAEDAVQETMLAALQGASRFAGQSSLKTWLIGILNSTPMQRWMQRASARNALVATNMINELPIPITLCENSELDRLARATMTTVAQRITLNQQGLATLVRNFAPLGVPVSSALRTWYDMDLAGLRVALRKSFKNDIPERLHDEWRHWLTVQREEHDALGLQINSNDHLINRIVAEYLPVPKG